MTLKKIIKKKRKKKLKVILSCCMHLMHPLDKPGWWTGEGESQADTSVWLLQRLTRSIPHTGSQQRAVEVSGGLGLQVTGWKWYLNIPALDFFKYLLWLLNVVTTVDANVLMLMVYRKQTHTIFYIIHHLMQHFPRIAIIVLLTLHC